MAISFGSSTTGAAGFSDQTLDLAHTVESDDDHLVVIVGTDKSDVLSVTLDPGGSDEASLTEAVGHERGTISAHASIWYLLATDLPSAGSYTVRVDMGDTDHDGFAAVSEGVKGAAQQGPEATSSSDDNSSGPTTSITTLTDGAVIYDSLGQAVGISDTSADGAQTEILNDTDQSEFGGAASRKILSTAGATDMSWSWSGDMNHAHVVAAFAPAANGGGTTKTLQLSDQLDFSDTAIGLQVKAPGFSDQMDLTDVLDVAGVRAVLASDQIDLDGLLSVRGVRSVQPADSLDLSDALTVKIAGVTITLVPSDQIDLSDTLKVPRKTRIQF